MKIEATKQPPAKTINATQKATNAAPTMSAASVVGTDVYKPPELLLGQRTDGRAADMWSTGVVLLEMMLSRPAL